MISEYLTYLEQNRRVSDHTLRAYHNDLVTFVAWAKPKGLRWSTLEKSDIDKWVSHLNTIAGYKPRTVKRMVSSVRSMLRWASINGKVETNAARYVQTPKPADTLPHPANISDLEKYLDTPISNARSSMVHALIALLLDSGIRLDEALNLEIADFDKTTRTIKIHGKGNRERVVYYTERAARHLANYRPNLVAGKLFTIDQRTARYAMYNELHMAHLSSTHPHAIRHAYATGMLANGCDIKTLSWLLGHKSVKTTELYTRAVNNAIAEQYRQYHV